MNNSDIDSFKSILKNKHYSVAVVEFLIQKMDSASITTFQQINDLIQKDTDLIINYFIENPEDLELIEKKNPLCLESMRDYLYKLFRGVFKKYGNDLNGFMEGLKIAFRNQLKEIVNSTLTVADEGLQFLRHHQFTKIMVFNYSKSIALSLKKFSKVLGNNLEVYACQSGFIGLGPKMFSELSMDNINCTLIADAEVGFYINEVDCVLTGAEVVLDDGSILNRSGTYMVALCAREARKPVICFAESYKFIKKTFLTQKDIPNHMQLDDKRKEPVILADLTPSNLIKLFCTDVGCLAPSMASFKMASLFA